MPNLQNSTARLCLGMKFFCPSSVCWRVFYSEGLKTGRFFLYAENGLRDGDLNGLCVQRVLVTGLV